VDNKVISKSLIFLNLKVYFSDFVFIPARVNTFLLLLLFLFYFCKSISIGYRFLFIMFGHFLFLYPVRNAPLARLDVKYLTGVKG